MAEVEKGGGQRTPGSGRGAKVMPTAHPVEEIYVDGALGMFARAGVVKINLYRVVGTDASDDAEVRSVSHRLVMPVAAVPDLVRLIQSMALSARQAQEGAAGGDRGQQQRRDGTPDGLRGGRARDNDPQNAV